MSALTVSRSATRGNTTGFSDEQDDLSRRLQLGIELSAILQLKWLETMDLRRAFQQPGKCRKIPLLTLADGNTMLGAELS
jgi:hypothetical protein